MCLAGIPYRLKGRETVYARGRPGLARIPDGTHVRKSYAGGARSGCPAPAATPALPGPPAQVAPSRRSGRR